MSFLSTQNEENIQKIKISFIDHCTSLLLDLDFPEEEVRAIENVNTQQMMDDMYKCIQERFELQTLTIEDKVETI